MNFREAIVYGALAVIIARPYISKLRDVKIGRRASSVDSRIADSRPVDSGSLDSELSRIGSFLDRISDFHLGEYKKYRYPRVKRVLNKDDLEHNRRHHEYQLMMANMECDEREIAPYGSMRGYQRHLHDYQSRDCKGEFYKPLPGCDCKRCD